MANVLVAEENTELLQQIRTTLESHGHQVFIAHDAGEAIDLLEDMPVEVVLCSDRLSRITGSDLMRCVRETYHLPGIIVCNANVMRRLGCYIGSGFCARVADPNKLPRLLTRYEKSTHAKQLN